MAVQRCPACGNQGSGRFCSQCGAPLQARFAVRRAWWAAGAFGLLTLIALVLVARQQRVSATAGRLVAEASPPPDISTMTPRARFDSLYNRVMRAAESGDTATVARFAPMVFAAYSQLDTVDNDARYHAAVLQLHVEGDPSAALRLADSILAESTRHLFGFLIRGTAAQLAGNEPLLSRARAGFLAAWEGEMKAGRQEYRDHQGMLDQFRAAALKGVAGRREGRE